LLETKLIVDCSSLSSQLSSSPSQSWYVSVYPACCWWDYSIAKTVGEDYRPFGDCIATTVVVVVGEDFFGSTINSKNI